MAPHFAIDKIKLELYLLAVVVFHYTLLVEFLRHLFVSKIAEE